MPLLLILMATYVLTIAAATKTLQLDSLQIQKVVNGKGRMSARIYSSDGSYVPALGAEISLTEDAVAIFGGHITKHRLEGKDEQGLTPLETYIEAEDMNAIPERRVVTDSFPSQILKTTLQSLVTDYLATDYGVSLAAGQVDGPVLPALEFDRHSLYDILYDILPRLSGGFLTDISDAKVLEMFTAGSRASPVNFVSGDKHILGDITVEPSRRNYANRLIGVFGPSKVTDKTDTFTGDGSTTAFTLDFDIANAVPGVSVGYGYVTNGGVTEALSNLGEGGTWEYDPSNRTIERVTAPANGNAISITYPAQFPFTHTEEDAAEIAANKLTERIVADDTTASIEDREQAEAYLQQLLAEAIATFKTVQLDTSALAVKAGQSATFTAATRQINAACLISQLTIQGRGHRRVKRSIMALQGTTFQRSESRNVYSSWLQGRAAAGSGASFSQGSSSGFFTFPNGVQLRSVSVELTDAEIKALPTTPYSLATALLVPDDTRVDILVGSFETNLVSAYTNINSTFAKLFLRWATSDTEFTEFVANDRRTSISGQTVASLQLDDLAGFLGIAGRRYAPIGHSRKAMNVNDWGTLPRIFLVTHADAETLEIAINNNGSGDLTGGNASNKLRLTLTYLQTPTVT